jgi:hypothetical protein
LFYINRIQQESDGLPEPESQDTTRATIKRFDPQGQRQIGTSTSHTNEGWRVREVVHKNYAKRAGILEALVARPSRSIPCELPKISPGEVNLFSHVTPTRIEAKNKGISSLRMKLLNIQTLVVVNGLIDRSTIAGPPSRGSGILKWRQKTTFATRYL